MASIVKKIKKGRPYYYAVEARRVGGKPRIVWQKYLGTIEGIIARTEEARPPQPKETVIFQLGGVAGLLGIAQRLDLVELIDEAVPKRDQGPTVGQYLVLAAINRALAPCSKLAIGEWYESTVLRRLWRFPKSVFTSQRFWDHMDMVSDEAIKTIEERLLGRLQLKFGIDARVLLYDTTNFFTFLATSNDRSKLAQRGHAKSKRHDLRLVGLALLVSRDFQIPLLHRTYPGNLPDVSLFPQISRELIARYRAIASECNEATLVFDKGNVSDDALEPLVVDGVHFVAALPAHRVPELLATPLEEFEDVATIPGTRVYTTQQTLWGRQCQVVVAHSESFFTQQLAGVTQNLVKCQKQLHDLASSLTKWHQGKPRGRRPTVKDVRTKVRHILAAQFMGDLFQISVTEHERLPVLRYSVDHDALQKLSDQRLGKTVLVTDQTSWTAATVVHTYRSLSAVEDAFRRMKDSTFLHWQPAYHWTDQKLAVHTFYCVLALLLATLAHREVVRAGIDLSLPALLDQLSKINEVAIIYPAGTLARTKDHVALSRMSPQQRRIAECLRVAEVAEG
jgi:transposase